LHRPQALYFVLTGDGRMGGRDRGKDRGQTYRRYNTLFCERGEQAAFEAEAPTGIVVLGLPRLDNLAYSQTLDAIAEILLAAGVPNL
jgi:hypothetical protein